MFKSEPQKQADEMKSSKYKLLILSVFAAFILCAAAYILFISKTDYLKIFVHPVYNVSSLHFKIYV